MASFLHILNGDSAVSQLAETGLGGVFLPWRDLLHEGPVPAGLSLEQTSLARASYLVETYQLDAAEVAASFCERDAQLRRYKDYDEVVLWSSRDLHDHCHLMQLLAFFADEQATNLTLVFSPTPFSRRTGLGELLAKRRKATPVQLHFGRRAWLAFCADDPGPLVEIAREQAPQLPFFQELCQRLFEEFPDVHSGLSRSQRQVLEIVATKSCNATESFTRMVALQDPAFMGDLSFWRLLDELATSDLPLLARRDGKPWQSLSQAEMARQHNLVLTDAGREVHLGHLNWLSQHRLDRWIGGVHLTH